MELHHLRRATHIHLANPASPVWKYNGVMFRVADFVAAARTNDTQLRSQDIKYVLNDAVSIYGELLAVFQDADAVWQYRRVPSAMFRELVDYEHVYQTVLASQMWNGYRVAVISLRTAALRIAKHLPDHRELDQPAQLSLQDMDRIINEAATETTAAVAQALIPVRSGVTHHAPLPRGTAQELHDSRLAQHTPVFHEMQPNSQALLYMHGCLLQWSVYFAADCEFVATNLRQCLVCILERAAKTMEIQQWKTLAEKLKVEDRKSVV